MSGPPAAPKFKIVDKPGEGFVVAASLGRKRVGGLGALETPKHFRVVNLHVEEDHRRRGIGKRLYRAASAEACRRGKPLISEGYQRSWSATATWDALAKETTVVSRPDSLGRLDYEIPCGGSVTKNPDESLRALERRSKDSPEDWLRWAAARLRAGQGPPVVAVTVKHHGEDWTTPVYLWSQNRGWGGYPDDGLLRPAAFWRYTDGTWGLGGFQGVHGGDTPERIDQVAKENAEARIRRSALTQHTNPPGRDDAISAAFREWQAGDDLSLERLMGERQRAGLDPKPEHPEYEIMAAGAQSAGWNGKKRMTGKQAEAALMHELKRRGWRIDRQPSQVSFNIHVWISPDSQRRVTFNAKTVTWEVGGRGHWTKDYKIHTYGAPASTIDTAMRLMLKKAAKPLTREEWTTPMQNPPGADTEVRTLQRAVMSGDAEAAFRMIQPEFGDRYRSPSNQRNAGFAAMVMWPRRVKRPQTGTLAGNLTAKPTVSEWYARLIWPEKWERLVEAKSKKAALKLPEVYGLATGFLPDKVLVVEDFHDWNPSVGTTKAYFVDYPGLTARSEAAKAKKKAEEARMTPGDWTARMAANPPDRDVVTSLASLAQHGRTSSTIPALVALTGRPQRHVEAVVRKLAERGVVAVRGPLVIFDRRIVPLVVGGGAVRMANPGADEERRARERLMRRQAETYGEADPETALRDQVETDRRTVPALGDRAYLRDIVLAWGIGDYVPVGVASKGLQAVFKKAGIKAGFRSESYSGGASIWIGGKTDADNTKIGELFGETPRRWADGTVGHTKNWTVHPNAREDKSDSMTDYYRPGGETLPAEYYATYAEAVQKALGSKDTADKKKDEKRAAKQAEKASATTLDEGYGDPVVGKRYYFDVGGRFGGVWEAARSIPGPPTLHTFYRVGKRGEVLRAMSMSRDNAAWLSGAEWAKALKAGQIKYGPTSNPGMATLGWATNPGGDLALASARKLIKKALKHNTLDALIARTHPRDQDKLKAEIDHLSRKSNPGGRALGRQQGGKKKTITIEQAIEMGIDKKPGFQKALKHYRKFHGANPHSVDIYVYENGTAKAEAKVVVTMGKVPETQYVVPEGKDSNKAGHHWVHRHKEKGKGTEPNLVFDPASGLMTIAGGTYKVTRWIYH